MKITLKSHNRKVPRKIEQELSWYDPYEKKMLKFRGTRLTFKYDPKLKRSIPAAITDEVPVNQNSWNDIDQWIKSKKRQIEVIDSIPRIEMTVEFDDYNWYPLEKELKKLKILHEIIDEN